MTGLYENINSLQNEKSLTFLYRAAKIELKPLNLRTIAENYHSKLSVDEETALKMARLTKGYSFAFQVLVISHLKTADGIQKCYLITDSI